MISKNEYYTKNKYDEALPIILMVAIFIFYLMMIMISIYGIYTI